MLKRKLKRWFLLKFYKKQIDAIYMLIRLSQNSYELTGRQDHSYEVRINAYKRSLEAFGIEQD